MCTDMLAQDAPDAHQSHKMNTSSSAASVTLSLLILPVYSARRFGDKFRKGFSDLGWLAKVPKKNAGIFAGIVRSSEP